MSRQTIAFAFKVPLIKILVNQQALKYIKFKKFNNSLKHRRKGGVFLYSTNTPKNKPHFDLKNQSAVCF